MVDLFCTNRKQLFRCACLAFIIGAGLVTLAATTTCFAAITKVEHMQRATLGILSSVLAASTLAAVATYFLYCPCTLVPGGWLLGEEISTPISDWSMANEVGLCQVQVTAGLPHSVNLNCMASAGRLFLSCSNCDGKRWSSAALRDPNGRIRIADNVYPVKLTRVLDPIVLDEAWLARSTKLERPLDTPRADGWWSFRVESR